MTNNDLPPNDLTSFYFNVPVIPEEEKPARILLVDDELGMQTSLFQLLSNRGFDVTTATTGGEAKQRLAEKRYDLILLDQGLPDMSGHDIMDYVNQKNLGASIIVISGDTQIDSAIGALQRGVFSYLRKPFPLEKLLNIIDNAIEKRALDNRNRMFARRLEYSEKLYRNLVDSSPDVIYTLDPTGRFTFVNDRAQQLLGYRPDELIGKHYSMLVHPDDLERAHYVFGERRTNERSSRNVELRLLCKNDERGERTFNLTLLTVSFSATGIYLPDSETGERQYSGAYVVARDVTDRKHAEEVISYQAHHDILTNLPNRQLFKEQLSLAIIQAKRHESKLAVMLLNLNRFKPVNDTLGHVMGDELLQQVARRLEKSLRPGDMLARLGGDEFSLILPCREGRDEATATAKKVIDSLRQPFLLDSYDLHMSASIGIAIYPDNGTSINELIRHADIAMYRVKTQRKDDLGFYDNSMQDVSHDTIAMEKNLRDAVENNELEMYYQPQVEVDTGRIVGAEALMRWNHPQRGLMSAGVFLPFAEENGLMPMLSDWLLGAVSRDILVGKAAGCPLIRLDINVSPLSLDQSDFFKKLQDTLKLYDLHPEQIGVEITENICIHNPQHAIDQINQLSKLGIHVSIDDFGT
ncbi:MAG: diguanylate cyclase, partial [Burkholderiaceae bacterium]|nr:diguanylate cyclase [Burkholderiaceae bacterium]